MSTSAGLDGWWLRLFERIDAGDAEGFLDFLDTDAEFRFGNAPSVHGTAAIGAAVMRFFGTIEQSRHELIRTWRDGRTRVCEGRVTYTRLDGSCITLPFVNVFEMAGEKVSRYLIYIDIAPLYHGATAT